MIFNVDPNSKWNKKLPKIMQKYLWSNSYWNERKYLFRCLDDWIMCNILAILMQHWQILDKHCVLTMDYFVGSYTKLCVTKTTLILSLRRIINISALYTAIFSACKRRFRCCWMWPQKQGHSPTASFSDIIILSLSEWMDGTKPNDPLLCVLHFMKHAESTLQTFYNLSWYLRK